MDRDRSIIHLNIADFAAAVESNIQPSLKGFPFIIAPQGAPRAVVYDMSDEAYRQGIRKGMPLARAKRVNKKIKTLPPSFNRYEQVMKALLKETFTLTPLIESGTTDGHIFLDVTGSARLFGPSVDMAFKLKKAFKKTFNLDPIWSVATNKLVAKVATRVVKPVGEYIVAPGDEKAFLAPLPIQLIPGLVKTDLTRLNEFNLSSVSQARTLTLDQLKVPFHQRAQLIYNRIRGIDPTPVTTMDQTHSTLQADHEFSTDTNNTGLMKNALYLLVEGICHTLRKKNLAGSAMKLILSYSDGLQRTSKLRVKPATANDMILFKKCHRLLDTAWTRRVRVRHLRLICEKSGPHEVQIELFTSKTKKVRQAYLTKAMDNIREKFGRSSIAPALTLVKKNSQP